MLVTVSRRRGSLEFPCLVDAEGAFIVEEGDTLLLRIEDARCPAADLGSDPIPLAVRASASDALTLAGELPIHTWAGRADLRVRDGIEEWRRAVDVRPHEGKLGRQAFAEMLEELAAVSKDLAFGESPGSTAATRDDRSPLIVLPALLEAERGRLEGDLARLRRSPLPFTERTRDLRPIGAGRIDTKTVRWLERQPATMARLQGEGSSAPDRALLLDLATVRVRPTHPVTRYLAGQLRRLRTQLRGADRLLLDHARRATDTGPRLRREAAREATAATLHLIERALRAPPFRGLPPAPLSEAALQGLIDHPPSERLHRTLLRLLAPGMRVAPSSPQHVGLRATHELFEMLVLLRTIASVRTRLGPAWQLDAVPLQRSGLLEEFPNNCVASFHHPGGTSIKVWNQLTFASFTTSTQSPRISLTGERRPDLVLSIHRGEVLQDWLLLDAKYRTSRSAVHAGLADMHVYRDALRWDGKPAGGGFIVVPRLREGTEAYAAPSFRERHGIGVIPALEFLADEWTDPLAGVLEEAAVGG